MQDLDKKEMVQKENPRLKILVMAVLLAALFVVSITIGRFDISYDQISKILGSQFLSMDYQCEETLRTVICNVRLPRVIAAVLIGASLSAAGAAYQGMFKNPLVSPDILGASAGAGFGAAWGIFLSLSVLGIQIMSFALGLLAVTISYGVSRKVRHDPVLALVLSGILTGSIFSALTSLLKYTADPYDKLPAITYWLMGSLASIKMSDVKMVILPMTLGILVLFLVRWKLNVLALGEDDAKTLGLNTNKLKLTVIFCATLVTAAAVSISGAIGWVGLLVPHIARMIVGPNYKYLLPASLLIGGSYLLLVDDLARSISAVEVPLGILTALIGAPFFMYLFSRRKR